VIVTWSPLAIERVAEIAAWIAADRPSAAEDLVAGIFDVVERLSAFPLSGRAIPEFERPELREIMYRRYRIVYRTTQDRVEILTVRHSLQLLDENDLG
jgi:toxin ParE1/3/4